MTYGLDAVWKMRRVYWCVCNVGSSDPDLRVSPLAMNYRHHEARRANTVAPFPFHGKCGIIEVKIVGRAKTKIGAAECGIGPNKCERGKKKKWMVYFIHRLRLHLLCDALCEL